MRRVGPELLTYFLCFKLLKLLSCLDWGGGGGKKLGVRQLQENKKITQIHMYHPIPRESYNITVVPPTTAHPSCHTHTSHPSCHTHPSHPSCHTYPSHTS